MQEVGVALCWKWWFPGEIRPEKEYIKSSETWFGKNVLNLNAKEVGWRGGEKMQTTVIEQQ